MNVIRFVFAAWYLVVGVVLLWQGWRAPSTFAWIGLSPLALLALVASWQGFVNGGLLWRFFQRAFGFLTLLLFLLCSGMAVGYLTGLLKAGPGAGGLIVYVVAVAALVLFGPVALYFVDEKLYRRHRRDLGESPQATAPVPPMDADEIAPRNRQQLSRKRFSRARIVTGSALLAVAILCIGAWSYLGSSLLCEHGRLGACRDAANDHKQRHDHVGAIALYERSCVDRGSEVNPETARSRQSLDCTLRDQALVQNGDMARLDSMYGAQCNEGNKECGKFVDLLDAGGRSDRAEYWLRAWCEKDPRDACERLSSWLFHKGKRDDGEAVIRASCERGDPHACWGLANVLVHPARRGEHMAALQRSCVLGAAEKSSARSVDYCGDFLRSEVSFRLHSVISDLEDVCAASADACLKAAAFFGHQKNLNNRPYARALADAACEKMAKSGRDEKEEPVCAERIDWPQTFVRRGSPVAR